MTRRLTQVDVFDAHNRHTYELIVGETDGCWFLFAGTDRPADVSTDFILDVYDSLDAAMADMRARGGVRFVERFDEVAEVRP